MIGTGQIFLTQARLGHFFVARVMLATSRFGKSGQRTQWVGSKKRVKDRMAPYLQQVKSTLGWAGPGS